MGILEQTLIFLPLLLGAYLTLSLLKVPDLSIESAFLFGGVFSFLAKDSLFPFCLLSSFAGGFFVGSLVSMINQFLKIPYLLSAIIVNGLIHGGAQLFLGTATSSAHYSSGFLSLIDLSLLIFSLVVLIAFVIRSELGLSLAIYGNNPHFFRHHNISEKYVVFMGVTLAHSLAGVSGFLFCQSSGFIDLNMNVGIILLCLTALMLGKMIVRKRNFGAFIPVVGLLGYFSLQQGLLNMGLNLKYFNALQAFFVLSFLTLHLKNKKTLVDHLGV